jgi:hypothetical protein
VYRWPDDDVDACFCLNFCNQRGNQPMTAVSRADVENALKGYVDPYLDQDLVATKCVKRIQIEGSRIELEWNWDFRRRGTGTR